MRMHDGYYVRFRIAFLAPPRGCIYDCTGIYLQQRFTLSEFVLLCSDKIARRERERARPS